jgi:RNA polymerase sigma-70 factor (ECF subfamily)
LQEARSGSAAALGRLLENCGGYLLMVARTELRAPLQAKVDAADVVQETFIEATRDFATFRGQTEPQLLAWLRGILRHNLTDVTRRFEMSCRCLSHEVSLDDPPEAEPACGGARTVCELLIAREQRRALDAALERLPPAYRQVLHLRYGEHWSYAQIGTSLRRSAEAARKLWSRALERLRDDMRIHGHV